MEERTARQEANGLRYGGLEEAAILRVSTAVSRQSLAECEESREPSAVL